MGEKIRDVGEFEVKGIRFTIELNESENPEPDIHIQNEDFRLAMPQSVFFEAGANILLARKQLRIIKGLDIS